MPMRSFSRRRFLQGLGASAALAPFLPLLNAQGATTAPKRLLLLYTPHGHYLPQWTPLGTPASFTLNKSMSVLAPHLPKLNVITGAGMKGWFHQNGDGQLWTGCEIPSNPDGSEPSDMPTNASVDQIVAANNGSATPYRSLEFGVDAGGAGGLLSRSIFAGTPVQAVEPSQSPADSFQQLFGQVSTQTLTDNKSVLDVVSGDLQALQGRISKADSYKLDQHLTAIRGIETRIASQAAACAGPNLNADTWVAGQASLPGSFAGFTDIIASAFACDLTRVASLQISKCGNDGEVYNWIGNTGDHHGLTHATPSDTADEGGNPSSYALSVNGQLAATDAWYAKMFSHLLDKLDAIPEGAGSVLDSTLIVWGTELAHCYTHATGQGGTPFVTAGGSLLGVKGGRWLNYPASVNDPLDQPQTEHNRLLVSIANYMGLGNITKFGGSDMGQGPLSGF